MQTANQRDIDPGSQSFLLAMSVPIKKDWLQTNQMSNGWSNGWMDTSSCRDARTHLKNFIGFLHLLDYSSQKLVRRFSSFTGLLKPKTSLLQKVMAKVGSNYHSNHFDQERFSHGCHSHPYGHYLGSLPFINSNLGSLLHPLLDHQKLLRRLFRK